MGTRNTLSYEDNTFNCTSGAQCDSIDDNHGARTVTRYNTFTNTAYQTHGLETNGRERGFRHSEVYLNNFTFSGASTPSSIVVRGGTGMIFKNTATGSFQRVSSVSTLRASETVATAGRGQFPFGHCGNVPVTLTRSANVVTATGNHYLAHDRFL